MNVVLSPQAEADIEAIGAYIEADNPARALSFVQDPIAACRNLGEFPLASPALSLAGHPGLRRHVYPSSLIVYRVTARVEIVRVLHGARDLQRILAE